MSAMSAINIAASERVVAKLREQATAHTEIASILTGQGTTEARVQAVGHSETARLFALLHAAVADGLLDRLQNRPAATTHTPVTTAGKAS